MQHNNTVFIQHLCSILTDIIYTLDDRSIDKWPTGYEKKIFDDAENLLDKLSNISEDCDIYLYENKNFIQNLLIFLKETVRFNNSMYPSYLSFNHLIDEFDNIVLDLERILRFDYIRMKADNEVFYLELNKFVLNPKRIEKMASMFDLDFFDYLNIIVD